jgi:uncharacterized repeat protein (TIGR02543 family)
VFVGWSTSDNATGDGNYKTPVYAAGSTYTLTADTTLYATWASTDVDAEFYIRLDGTIATEPQGHASSEYTGAIKIADAVSTAAFYANSTEGVGSHLLNQPTDDQIKTVCNAKGISYDPDTQYVLWYVIKQESTLHVDGVLLDRAKVNLSYNANAPAGEWANMPDGAQYVKDSTATVSSKVPTRPGYTFSGWNTAADGTGTSYASSADITMSDSVTLYAQWIPNDKTAYTVQWVAAGTGTVIKTVTRYAKTDVTASVTDADKTLAGYTYAGDSYAGTVLSGNVSGDGSLVLKLYFSTNITVTAPTASKTYDGTALTATTATLTAGTLAEGDTLVATATGSATNVSDSGTGNNVVYSVKVMHGDVDVTANYAITKAAGNLTITPATLTVTTPDATKAYDGGALTAAGTLSGLVTGETATFSTTGTQTNVGESTNGYDINWDGSAKQGNYTIDAHLGKLTVTSNSTSVTLTAPSDERTYDGTALTRSTGTTETGLPAGFTFEATVSGSQTDAGSSDNTVTGYKIYDASHNDVTGSFTNVTTVVGKLTVNPVAISVKANDATKAYDGTALTDSGYSIASGAFVGTDGLAAVTVEGSQTFVGSSANTVTDYTLADGTNASNYVITKLPGTLSVTNENPIVITVTAPTASKTYDGTALTATTATLTAGTLAEGDTLVATATGSATNVSDSGTGNNVVYSVKVMHGDVDVTANYAITKAAGNLTITPATLTVTTPDATKAYDGGALTAAGTLSGLVTGETATFSTTGTQTNVGESTNGYDINWDGSAKQGNYTIDAHLGKLTVTSNSTSVTLTAPSDERTYDGTALTRSTGTTETGLPAGFTFEATVSGSQTDAGSSDNTVTGYKIYDASHNDVTGSFTNVKTVVGKLTVDRAKLTLTSVSLSKTYDGTALTNGTASLLEDGWVSGQGADYDFTGAQTESGSSANSFSYKAKSGTNLDNYDITKSEGALTVDPVTSEVVVTINGHSANATYDGASHSVTGYTVASISNSLYTANDFSLTGTDTVSAVDAGSYPMGLTAASFANTSKNYTNVRFVVSDGSLEVAKRAVTLTSATDTKVYDGTELKNSTVTVSGEGWATGEGATYDVTGAITSVGSTTNDFTYVLSQNAKSSNYAVTETLGTLTVTKADAAQNAVTVTPYAGTYDGSAHTVSATAAQAGSTLLYSTDGQTWSETAPTWTDVTSAQTVHVKATNPNYGDATADGTVTITPATLTVTTPDATKAYDGGALTAAGTLSGLVTGETATFSTTGTQTEAGSSTNTYALTWDGTAKSSNYAVTETLGTLTVTKADAAQNAVTVTSYESAYDGSAHTVSATAAQAGSTLLYSTDGQTWSETAPTWTDVTSAQTVHVKATNPNYGDATADGTVTITPAALTVTTGSQTWTYDGQAHSNATVTSTGLVNGETVSAATDASITDEGSTPNTYAIDWAAAGTTAKQSNYTVTDSLGTLTVDAAAYDVTATPYAGTYDGQAHGVTVTAPADATVTYDTDNAYTDVTSGSVTVGYKVTRPNYKDITGTQTVTITPAPLKVTTPDATKAYDGGALTAAGTLSGLVTGETATFSTTGTQTEAGSSTNTYALTWDGTAKASNYAVTETLGTLTVTKADAAQNAVTVTPYESAYDGSAHTVSATAAQAGSTLLYSTDGQTWSETAPTWTDVTSAQTVHVKATNPNYGDATADGTVTITPAALTVTTGSQTWTYDGQAHSNATVTSTGLVNGETVSAATDASITDEGSTPNTYAIDWAAAGTTAKQSNYTVTDSLGTLTVTDSASPIIVTTVGSVSTYDGHAHGATVSVSSLPTGYTLDTAASSASATDVTEGSVSATADKLVIRNASGQDVTSRLNITYVDGTVTITPAALTVTTPDATKAYDGGALTAAGTLSGLVPGETATFSTTGTQTEAGSSTNTYALTWDGTAKSSNYAVTETLGTLTVTKADAAQNAVTVTSYESAYDGSAHTVSATAAQAGSTLLYSTDGQTWSETAPTWTDVTSAQTVHVKATNPNYGDATADGTVTITPAALTVTTGSQTWTYDGQAHSNATVTSTGLVNGETVSAATDASITDEGSTPNTYAIDWAAAGTTAKQSNYTVTDSLGTLTVDAAAYDVTATPYAGTYDGQAHGITVTAPADATVTYDTDNAYTDVTSGSVTVGYKVTRPNYKDITGTQTVTITPAPLKVTTPDATKAYDGGALTAAGTLSGLVTGETATFSTTGTQTEAGSSTNTYALTWDGTAKASNYAVTETLGTLTVTKADLTDAARFTVSQPADVTYDGLSQRQPLTVTDATTGKVLVEGTDYTLSYSYDTTDVGTVTATVTGIGDYAGTVDRTYKITPAQVTVTTPDATKAYDGGALTAAGTLSGLVTGETATFSTTGTQTEAGSSTNTYALTWDGTAKSSNYAVTETLGTLTVTKADAAQNAVTVTSYESAYDGSAHTVSATAAQAGSTLLYSTDGQTWSETAPTWTDVTSAQTVHVKATNPNYGDATADGTVTITPAQVTVTAAAASKAYGDADPALSATADGTLGDDTISYTVSRTNEDEAAGTYAGVIVPAGEATQGNYAVTYVPADFTITKAGAAQNAVTVTSYEGAYDGSAHTVSATAAQAGSTLLYSTDGQTWSETAPTWTDVTSAQTVHVKATNPNYEDATADGTVTITPAQVTVTAAASLQGLRRRRPGPLGHGRRHPR